MMILPLLILLVFVFVAATNAFLSTSRSSCPCLPRVTALQALTRRDVLEDGSQAASSLLLSRAAVVKDERTTKSATKTSSSSSNKPLCTPNPDGLVADLPMIRLRLPPGGFGREYLAIPVKVQGQGPFDFMVDTGLTTELVTPHLQQILGLSSSSSSANKGSLVQGISAGGTSTTSALIDFPNLALDCGNGAEYPLPLLHAVVTDFPQEHLDPAHDPVEGMIGMEALSLFDVDLDFPNNRIRLYEPGRATSQAEAAGLVEIPAVVINETGLLGIRIATPSSSQPILGVLDCGATFSVINWAATKYLGLPTSASDPQYRQGPMVAGVGVDGRTPMAMPTIRTSLTFAGNIVPDPNTGQPAGFATSPTSWKPWQAVPVAVGDIPAFSSMLGDGVKPYQGPAALIGLDVLAQRRVILETAAPGTSTRRRRVWVSPK